MSFLFDERPDSRSGTLKPPTETRKYFAKGSRDRNFVEAYAQATVPSAVLTNSGTLYRQDIQFEAVGSDYFVLTVPYAKNQKQTGSLSWGFDTTGGTVNIKASLSTVGSYGASPIKKHGGAIGVTKDSVEGTEIVIPALKLNVSYSHPAGQITLGQARTLARYTGQVNSTPMFGFQAGEVLFLGATGNDGSESAAEVGYQFACQENLQNQLIGGIEVLEKQGWDYAWIDFQDAVESGSAVKKPLAVHVERVYRRSNLGMVLGFG